MFTGPAEARFGRQRTFQQRRRVDKGAKIELSALFLNHFSELFQAIAQYFVVIASQSVAADIAELRVFQRTGKGGFGRKIVHAYADNAQRAGQQFMRTRAHHAVARHPLHFAVILFVQPRLQTRLFRAEIGVGDADLLKAEILAPLFNLLSKLMKIERV